MAPLSQHTSPGTLLTWILLWVSVATAHESRDLQYMAYNCIKTIDETDVQVWLEGRLGQDVCLIDSKFSDLEDGDKWELRRIR